MNNYADKIKSMYEEDTILKPFDHVNHRRSIVDLYPSDIEEADFEVRGNILSRRNSAVPSIASHHGMAASLHSQVGDVDTLDQVANVASQHNTLYSYHYMDETDKTVRISWIKSDEAKTHENTFNFQMKFTKIFDVTDSETSMVQSQTERETNQMVQYEESNMTTNEEDEQNQLQHDLDVLLPESREIMGDWTCAEIKVDEINSGALEEEDKRQDLSPTGSTSSIESMDSFYKPEADQSEHEQFL